METAANEIGRLGGPRSALPSARARPQSLDGREGLRESGSLGAEFHKCGKAGGFLPTLRSAGRAPVATASVHVQALMQRPTEQGLNWLSKLRQAAAVRA